MSGDAYSKLLAAVEQSRKDRDCRWCATNPDGLCGWHRGRGLADQGQRPREQGQPLMVDGKQS